MKVKLKKPVDVPPQIQAVIDKVVQTPVENIAQALDGFSWVYDKLFNHFDSFFETYIKPRPDLQLQFSGDQDEPVFPLQSCLAVLSTTACILENCSNKHLYQSYEGLDLTSCVHATQTPLPQGVHRATSLHFEFYAESQSSASDLSAPGGLRVIDIPAMDTYTDSPHQILKQLVDRFSIPPHLRFDLLCRILVARGFGSLEGRRQLVQTRLLAFFVWFQSNPIPEDVALYFAAEPEFVSELVTLIQTEEGVPQELRTLALRALAVQITDRSRHSAVIHMVCSGGQSGLLSMLLHKSVSSLVSSVSAQGTQPAAAATPCGTAFIEALLYLVGSLVSSTSGVTALADAGVISALLPLLRDTAPEHLSLVATTVKILESYMDFSQAAATMFRDLGGLTEMINRLKLEVLGDAAEDVPMSSSGEASAAPAPASSEGPAPSTAASAADAAAASSTAVGSAVPAKQIPYTKRLLLKFLLRAIALASYAPSAGPGMRPAEADAQMLYGCLRAMFLRADEFGGSLFALAASVVTDLIHHDPLCFRTLDEAGLPEAFLRTIKAGVLPYGEAVCAIPSTLVALCLNIGGLQRVRAMRALDCMIPIFTTKKYVKALASETPSILGSGLEELFRLVPDLRPEGIEMVVSVFKALCILGGDEEEAANVRAAVAAAEAAARAPATPAAPDTMVDAAAAPPTTPAADAPEPMETDNQLASHAAQPSTSPMVPDATAPGDGTAPLPDIPAVADAAGQLDAGAAASTSDAAGTAPAEQHAAESMEVTPVSEAAEASGAAAAVPESPAGGADAGAEAGAVDMGVDVVAPAQQPAPPPIAPAKELIDVIANAAAPDVETFLPECVHHAARMLESLLSNNETARQFVEKRGVDLMLKIHTLPRLQPAFGFSSASHPLLTAFRTISPNHAQAVSQKTREALAERLDIVQQRAAAIGGACLPTLPAAERDEYVRLIMSVAGLVGMASTVARNSSNMLVQVAPNQPVVPVIARLGQLERLVMLQLAAGEEWRATKEAEKPVAEKAAGPAATPNDGLALLDLLDPGRMFRQQTPEPELPDATAPETDGEAEVPMEVVVAEPEAAGRSEDAAAAAAAAAAAKSAKPKKKTPEEQSLDALAHVLHMCRSFYTAVAKSIHTPARRREDANVRPTSTMRAAALALAVTLKGNLEYQLPEPQQQAGTSGAAELSYAAKAAHLRVQLLHTGRLVEELHNVMVDARRRACHSLVLNYFVGLGGLQPLAAHFRKAIDLLFEALALPPPPAEPSSTAPETPAASTPSPAAPAQDTSANGGAPPGAQPADAAAGASTAAAAGQLVPAAVDPAAIASKSRDPKTLAHRVVLLMLSLYEQASNASLLLSSPQAASLLVVPLPSVGGAPITEPARDAQAFVRELQAGVLAAVLPFWRHPQLAAAPQHLVNVLLTVLNHCADGTAHAPQLPRLPRSGLVAAARPAPDAALVQTIVEMGFSQARAEAALRHATQTGQNVVETAMEWLIAHPEDPAAPAAGAGGAGAGGEAPAAAAPLDEDEELSRALTAALAAIGSSPEELRAKDRTMADADSAAVPAASVLVASAVSMLERLPASSFAVADLLATVCSKEEGRERKDVMDELIARFRGASPAACEVASRPALSIFTAGRLLLILLMADNEARQVAAASGLAGKALELLEAWGEQYSASVAAALASEQADGQTAKQMLAVPVWVDVALLILDTLANATPKKKPPTAAPGTAAATATAAPAADDVPAAEAVAAPADATAAAAVVPDAAAAPPAAPPAAEAATAEPMPADATPEVPPVDAAAGSSGNSQGLGVLGEALAAWSPCGLLSEDEQQRALAAAMLLLRQLHACADKWDPINQGRAKELTSGLMDPEVLKQPSAVSTAQAVLQLLAKLTRRHQNALQVLAQGGPRLLLSLPAACMGSAMNASRLEPSITAIMRHILEDRSTLRSWMEAEIKSVLTVRNRARDVYGGRHIRAEGSTRKVPIQNFFSMMTRVINRNPEVFMEAVAESCVLEEGLVGGEERVITLRRPSAAADRKPRTSADDQPPAPTPAAEVAGGPEAVAAATPAAAARPAGAEAGPAATPAKASTAGATPGPQFGRTPSKTGRATKKHMNSSFVEVVESILEVILAYDAPSPSEPATTEKPATSTTPTAMEVDTAHAAEAPAAAAAPTAATPEAAPAGGAEAGAAPDAAAAFRPPALTRESIIQIMSLKMLTEFCLVFGATVGLVLKRDSEGLTGAAPTPHTVKKGPKAEVAPVPQQKAGPVLKHIMHHHLLADEPGLLPSLGEQAGLLLRAICIRSSDGRKRIISQLVATLMAGTSADMDAADKELALSVLPNLPSAANIPFLAKPGLPAPAKIRAFVALLGSLVHASAAPPVDPRNLPSNAPPGVSFEMIRSMRDAGAVKALAQALQLVNLDHPRATKAVNAILKPLEVLTRSSQHVHQLLATRAVAVEAAGAANATSLPNQAAPDSMTAVRDSAPDAGAAAAAGPAAPAAAHAAAGPGGDAAMEEEEHIPEAGPQALAEAERLQGMGGIGNEDIEGMAHMFGAGVGSTHAAISQMIFEAMQQAEGGGGMDEDMGDEEEEGGSSEDLGVDDDEDEGDDEEGHEMMAAMDMGPAGGIDADDEDEEGHGARTGHEDYSDEDDDDEVEEEEHGHQHEDHHDHHQGGEVVDGEEEELEHHMDGGPAGLVTDEEEDEMEHEGEEGDEEDMEEEEEEDEDDEVDEEGSEGMTEQEDWEYDMAEDDLGAGPAARRTALPMATQVWGGGLMDPDGAEDVALALQPPNLLFGRGLRANTEFRALPESVQVTFMQDLLADFPGHLRAFMGGHAGRRPRFRLIQPESMQELAASGGGQANLAALQAQLLGFMPPGAGSQHRLLVRPPQLPGQMPGHANAILSAMSAGNTWVAPNLDEQWQAVTRDPMGGFRDLEVPARLRNLVRPVGAGRWTTDIRAELLNSLQDDPMLAGLGGRLAFNADLNGVQEILAAADAQRTANARTAGQGEDTSVDMRALERYLVSSLQEQQPLQPPAAAVQPAPELARVPDPTALPVLPSAEPPAPQGVTAGGDTAAAAAPATATAEVAEATAAAATEPPPAEPEAMQQDVVAPAPEEPVVPQPAPEEALPQTPAPQPPPAAETAPGAPMAAPQAQDPSASITADFLANALHAAMQAMQPPGTPQGGLDLAALLAGAQQPEPTADGGSPMDTEEAAPPAPPSSSEPAPEVPSSSAPMEGVQSAGEELPQPAQPAPAGDEGDALSPELRAAAEAAGIDITFLEALPPELRAEVLAAHGAQLSPPAVAPAPAPAVAEPEAAAAAAAAPDAAAPAAGADDADLMEGLDPEFLAALPPDIQAELLAQQRAEQRRRQQQRQAEQAAAAAPRGEELDLASLLATFPPDVREDVLLNSPDELLNTLPPALLAEAQELRQRHMRDHFRTATDARQLPMFGGAPRAPGPGGPAGAMRRLPRLESWQAREMMAGLQAGGRPPGLDARLAAKLADIEATPQLDEEDLVVLIQLLKVVQPASKNQLQKVLSNLAAHGITRQSMLRMMLSLLRAIPAAEATSSSTPMEVAHEEPASPGAPRQISEALDSLQEHQPAAAAGGGALVASSTTQGPAHALRRVMESLTFLCKQNSAVARLMLTLPVPASSAVTAAPQADDRGKGKASASSAEDSQEQPHAVEVLLSTLGQPLCQRSNIILEHTLQLLEVLLLSAAKYSEEQKAAEKAKEAAAAEKAKEVAAAQAAATTAEAARPDAVPGDAAATTSAAPEAAGTSASTEVAASTPAPAASAAPTEEAGGSRPKPGSAAEALEVLNSVPGQLLSQLPALLSRPGLSDSIYTRAASVLRALVEVAPVHLGLVLSELVTELSKVAMALMTTLFDTVQKGIDASSTTLANIAAQGSMVLRMLHCIDSFHKKPKQSAALQAALAAQQLPTAAELLAGAAGAGSAAAAVAGTAAAARPAPPPELPPAVAEVATSLEPLWKALSSCISLIEENLKPAQRAETSTAAKMLPPGAAQMLPLVEAFFVLCSLQDAIPPGNSLSREPSLLSALSTVTLQPAPSTSVDAARTFSGASTSSNQGGAQQDEAKHASFLRFAEKHRRLLNAYLRRSPALLESSLSPLLRASKLIDFDNKRAWFRSRVRAHDGERHHSHQPLRISVRREHVFEDSYHQLRSKTVDDLKGKLTVQFQGEEGIDAGGVSREWYQVMAREIFNPNLALFVNVPEGGTTFQPNPNSVVQNDRGTNHLDFFRFVGRIVGKALHDGQLMDAYFTRSFYKHTLGITITYEDIEAVDPEYYKNLKWMLENDITDVLDLTFTAETDFFGRKEIVELVPGGKDMKVTESNKREYANLIARHRMTTSIRGQIQAFLEGFWELIPRHLISLFNDHELELLISGLPDIDVADLRANTEYQGFTAASPVVQWFWEVVGEMEKEDLALLLQFVTGTSKVPLEGFKALQGISGPQRFQIHKAYGASDRLPSAHTCFNQLDVPEYESKAQLAERLRVAIHEGAEGFGFG